MKKCKSCGQLVKEQLFTIDRFWLDPKTDRRSPKIRPIRIIEVPYNGAVDYEYLDETGGECGDRTNPVIVNESDRRLLEAELRLEEKIKAARLSEGELKKRI